MAEWYRVYLPMQEMQKAGFRSLGQKDLPEEGMATHSSILAWRMPWTEKHGGYSPQGCIAHGVAKRHD